MSNHYIDIQALILYSYEEHFIDDYEMRFQILKKAHRLSKTHAIEQFSVHWHMLKLEFEFRKFHSLFSHFPKMLAVFRNSKN